MFTSCMKEDECPCVTRGVVDLRMGNVPYWFMGGDTVQFVPYYVLTNELDLLVFRNRKLDELFSYDYEFCRENEVIPLEFGSGRYDFLFMANIADDRLVSWFYNSNNQLDARFVINDNREPPVYLAFVGDVDFYHPEVLPVVLKMLVSRIDISLVNTPEWVTGIDVTARNVAREVTIGGVLRDTTSVMKQVTLGEVLNGAHRVGVNSFPTYPGIPALVNINLKGGGRVSTLVVEDERLELLAGQVLRINLEFQAEGNVTVSLDFNGKWEIIDEGQIEI